MEKITRRTIMKAAVFAGIPAGGVTAFVHDPLADAICNYREEAEEFNAIPIDQITMENEEGLVSQTYGPYADILWRNPPEATTLRGVTEAIRYAVDSVEICDGSVKPVLRSALAYLDKEGGAA